MASQMPLSVLVSITGKGMPGCVCVWTASYDCLASDMIVTHHHWEISYSLHIHKFQMHFVDALVY